MKKQKDQGPYDLAQKAASGEKPDFSRAYKLLDKAKAAGDPRATYALGTWYLHGRHVKRNLSKAIRYLREAADRGVAAASFDLAVSYEKGFGVRKNNAMAAQHYVRAALSGDKQSVYEVGRCFYHGIGVERNRKIANVWLDRARELRGIPRGQTAFARKCLSERRQ